MGQPKAPPLPLTVQVIVLPAGGGAGGLGLHCLLLPPPPPRGSRLLAAGGQAGVRKGLVGDLSSLCTPRECVAGPYGSLCAQMARALEGSRRLIQGPRLLVGTRTDLVQQMGKTGARACSHLRGGCWVEPSSISPPPIPLELPLSGAVYTPVSESELLGSR